MYLSTHESMWLSHVVGKLLSDIFAGYFIFFLVSFTHIYSPSHVYIIYIYIYNVYIRFQSKKEMNRFKSRLEHVAMSIF